MQDSVVAVFDMSPELILVPRAFIILVSVDQSDRRSGNENGVQSSKKW